MQPDDDSARVIDAARRALDDEELLSADDRELVRGLLADSSRAADGPAVSSLADVILSYPPLRRSLQGQSVRAAHAPPHELPRRRALLYLGRVARSRWPELSAKRWSALALTELSWAIKDAESGDDRAAEQILTILRRNPDTIRWINEVDPRLKDRSPVDRPYHSASLAEHLTATTQEKIAPYTSPSPGRGDRPPRSRRPFEGGGGQQGG